MTAPSCASSGRTPGSSRAAAAGLAARVAELLRREYGADRVLELSLDLSIFIMDTELRMKDKIVVLFEEALPKTPLVGLPVERVKAELFRVGGRIFIINSKDGLAANIGEIISLYLKKEAGCPAA